MDILDNAFFHLKHLPLVDSKHAEIAVKSTYSDVPSYYQAGTQNVWAEAEEFSASKFCRDIRAHFGECIATYLKTSPMTGYDWHIDLERRTCINILLVQPPTALTLHKLKVNRLTCRLKVCDYEIFRPTLFNAVIPHCVLNPSDQDRYMLTISVGKDPTFDEFKEWLINYQTDSY